MSVNRQRQAKPTSTLHDGYRPCWNCQKTGIVPGRNEYEVETCPACKGAREIEVKPVTHIEVDILEIRQLRAIAVAARRAATSAAEAGPAYFAIPVSRFDTLRTKLETWERSQVKRRQKVSV